jgi:hypothetical protein
MTDRISEIRASLANVAFSGRYYPGDVEADIAYLLDRVEALEKALRRYRGDHERDAIRMLDGLTFDDGPNDCGCPLCVQADRALTTETP